ncbi:MAG: peptidase E [Marinifilaceae bacterium]
MKKTLLIILLASICQISLSQVDINSKQTKESIFVFGGDINLKFTRYIAELTHKKNPKICYVPTASADNKSNIKLWNFFCKRLDIKPYVLKVWVSSNKENKSFEDILLNMDAIVVGGGNTLNMLGIWKAQGIDKILKKALQKGIILSGGSAGSICWFKTGISDSRPVNLSVINGLSFLPFSNCPHYSDNSKKELYHEQIKNKKITPGYACDERSGILFRNGKYVETVSINDINNSYYVSLKNGEISALKLTARMLVKKGALDVSDYKTILINKAVKEYAINNKQDSPLNSFVGYKRILSNGKMSKTKALSCSYLQNKLEDNAPDKIVNKKKRDKNLNTIVNKIFIYNDVFAGVVNRMYDDYYGLWYFYKENGKWLNAGEDMGGDTVLESEITFREKAKSKAAFFSKSCKTK